MFTMIFFYAVSITMIGPLMQLIIADFDLRLSVAGLLVSFQQLGGAIAIVGSALFADRVHKPLLIAGAFSIYSLSLFFAGAATGYVALAAAFFAIGAGSRLFDSVTNAHTSQWDPARSAFYLSMLHTVFAVGALVGPLYANTLIDAGAQWRTVYVGLGIAAAATVSIYVTTPRFRARQTPAAGAPKADGVLTVLLAPRMWIACAVMFAYVGHQAGFTVWLPMYLQVSLSASARLGAAAVSLYWLGIIIGRLMSARVSARISIKRQLWTGGLVGAAGLLIAAVIGDPIVFTAATFLAGIASGGVIPNLVTLCCSWFPANTATASSMLFLMASFGHMIFPWLIALVSERSGFNVGFLIPIVALAMVAALTVVLPRPARD